MRTLSPVPNRSGFSMLEMAVVLTIVALLVGGFMTTTTLITTAKLRGVSADAQQYMEAAAAFRDKFDSLPGDFPGASAIWGAATCPNGADTTGATCNGDGNGVVAGQEVFRAWQHMANAGYVGGKFTGVGSGSSNIQADPGTNIPKASIAATGYNLFHSSLVPTRVPNLSQHMIVFGAPTTGNADGAALDSQEALNIDRKLDDGQPFKGNVMVYLSMSFCADSGVYFPARDAPVCNLVWVAPY